MPVLWKSPEMEKLDNRSRILSILLNKSLTFTEVLKESELSRATVSKHLDELQKLEVIEKAIENDRVVYRLTPNEEALESELLKTNYDFLLKILSSIDPGMELLMRISTKLTTHLIILNRKRMIDGKPPITEEEWKKISVDWIRSELTEEDFKFIEENQKLWPNLRVFARARESSENEKEEDKQ